MIRPVQRVNASAPVINTCALQRRVENVIKNKKTSLFADDTRRCRSQFCSVNTDFTFHRTIVFTANRIIDVDKVKKCERGGNEQEGNRPSFHVRHIQTSKVGAGLMIRDDPFMLSNISRALEF